MIHPIYGTEIPHGTLIHGTGRLEDLIPTFLSTAKHLVGQALQNLTRGYSYEMLLSDPIVLLSQYVVRLHDMQFESTAQDDANDYYSSDSAFEDLDYLIDLLSEFSQEGHHFGSHEGDGSDYGWWPNGDDPSDGDPEISLTNSYIGCAHCAADTGDWSFGKPLGCDAPGCESVSLCCARCLDGHTRNVHKSWEEA